MIKKYSEFSINESVDGATIFSRINSLFKARFDALEDIKNALMDFAIKFIDYFSELGFKIEYDAIAKSFYAVGRYLTQQDYYSISKEFSQYNQYIAFSNSSQPSSYRKPISKVNASRDFKMQLYNVVFGIDMIIY
jgi:regulator of sigma D